MKKEVGQLVKHSGIYGLGTILNKSVGFFMIPVYTHYLKPADYGVLELLDLTLFFSGIFAMMGISSAFFRFFVAADSKDEKKDVTTTALFSVVGISVSVLVLMLSLASQLSIVTFGNASYSPLVKVVAFTLFFSNLSEVPLAYVRAKQRTILYVTIGLIRTFLSASLLILAVAVLQKGVLGVVYANLVSNSLASLIMVGVLVVQVRGKFSRRKLDEMLKYGGPLVVQSIAGFVLVYSDRYFLRHFANLTEVGIYGLGYKLAGVVAIVVSGPFGMAWSWQQFELAKEENAKELYSRIQVYQLVVYVFVGLGITVLAKDALRIMTPASYWDAARVVPLIALSYILSGVRSIIWTGILVRRVTHHLAWISIVVAGANLLLNYVLIPRYLYMGAAVATVLSYALSLGLGYVLAQRAYHVHYDYLRNALVLGSAGLIYLVSRLVTFQLIASIAVNVLFALVFLVVAIVMLKREERTMFWQLGARAIERLRNLRPQQEA
jgi:O-antigen/teichoic acid export membrane protein